MREIKFRFWSGEQMFYRHLFEVDNRTAFVTAPMQYTGLKDKNGKEIYEGDIMKCYPSEITGIVRWNDMLASFELLINNYMYKDCSATIYGNGTREVIGNIYENPELL